MPLLHRRSVLLAKVEATKGTDAAPVAADAIPVVDLESEFVKAESVERNVFTGNSFPNPAKAVGAKYFAAGGKVELVASGARGTSAKWGRFLRAAGMKETVTAATSVVYVPRVTDFESLSARLYLDGVEQKGVGCVSTGKLMFNAGEIPMLEFALTGEYSRPTDIATPDTSNIIVPQPLIVSGENTTLTLHGVALNASAFELDLGVTVAELNKIGNESADITNIQPVGSVTFELPLVATKNWAQIAEEAAEGALALTFGSGAGDVISIDADRVSLSNLQRGEGDGVINLTADLNFAPNSDGETFSLTMN